MRFVFVSFYKITNLVNFINPCRNMLKAVHESVVSLFADFFIHLFGSLGPFSGILKLFWCFLEPLSDTIQPWKENLVLSHPWEKNNVLTWMLNIFIIIQVSIFHLFSVSLYIPVCVIINLSNKINIIFPHAFPSSLNVNLLFHCLHVGCINSIKIGIHVAECFCHDLCLFFDIFWSIQLQNPLTCTCKSRKKYNFRK